MSAWICSDKHICAVVTAYAAAMHITDKDELQRIAALLLEENTKSVDYRYRETNERFDIKFEPVEVSPIDAYKLTRSLAYQSCEHPGWNLDDSEACRIVEGLIANFHDRGVHTDAPGYDKAKWSLE